MQELINNNNNNEKINDCNKKIIVENGNFNSKVYGNVDNF